MPLSSQIREGLQKTGAFTVQVVPSRDWLALRPNPHQSIPWHESVLRPLLAVTSAAWVYGLKEDSEVFAVARPIVRREGAKHRIDLGAEAIRGHELLWNAAGGKRGSIVLAMPASRFPGQDIFPHCQDAFVVSNSTVAHTPGAIRFARSATADRRTLCCLLSRTNGFEWLSIHSNAARLENLLVQAQSLVVNRAWYAPGAG
jgi:hypothetical protein